MRFKCHASEFGFQKIVVKLRYEYLIDLVWCQVWWPLSTILTLKPKSCDQFNMLNRKRSHQQQRQQSGGMGSSLKSAWCVLALSLSVTGVCSALAWPPVCRGFCAFACWSAARPPSHFCDTLILRLTTVCFYSSDILLFTAISSSQHCHNQSWLCLLHDKLAICLKITSVYFLCLSSDTWYGHCAAWV